MIYFTIINTPVGELLVVKKQATLYKVFFSKKNKHHLPNDLWKEDKAKFSKEIQEISDYFSGKLKKFSNIPIPEGTDFQQKIWKALLDIPYGSTISYQDIAIAAGSPNACRAAGNALNINPLPLIIPCHRVIGKDGSLTGFGSGIPIKKHLLELEQKFSK
ncbi:MAG: methylated-DNA--[protein]-cysteine S-methyltransferase [Desulfobacterales bacterium]|nr:methylated-DNA--[protein]-cysteine S-methyltransferase [Desulfobacterales bacterium]